MIIGVEEDRRILPGKSRVVRFQLDSRYWKEVFLHERVSPTLSSILEIFLKTYILPHMMLGDG